MEQINKIIFGDNQFFGINHMSQEKAQQLSEKFYDIQNIIDVYELAFKVGIDSIMLNSNDRAKQICKYFEENRLKYSHINWYPSIPYPHKYANLISEKGIFSTINELLFKNNSALGAIGILSKGSSAMINTDAIKLMQLFIDLEMRMFKNFNIKTIFLQNIITDLILGLDIPDLMIEYCNYIRKKYNTTPGFITQNLPRLYQYLKKNNIEQVVICTSINKIGYLMSPNIESYVNILQTNDKSKYQIMAMSTLASGAIKPKDAYSFINELNIQSVVFGASDKRHIEDTYNLIKI